MLVLAVDTSGIACSVAVADENKLYGEFYTDLKLKHSEKLMPLADGLLKNIKIDISEIDIFAFVCGPGSFTGLRIGAATVKGFAQALNKPVVCVSTLETLAAAQSASNKLVCPILDAQRDQVYTSIFENKNGIPVKLINECAESLEELLSRLMQMDCPETLFCGDGVLKYSETIKRQYEKAFFAPFPGLMPRASYAAYIAVNKAMHNETVSFDEIDINYLRSSQAEVNYKVEI